MMDDLKALVLFSSGFAFGFMASAVAAWYLMLTKQSRSSHSETKDELDFEKILEELQSDRSSDG